jgi:CheY-like chemotaxis protein
LPQERRAELDAAEEQMLMDIDEVRVLVVDDVQDAADMLACALELDGYKVWTAHDGLEALALIEQHNPHCILLDIDLPGLDGNELCKRVRERYVDDIVLIAVSGWDIADRRVADGFARADHYLRKPVDLNDLRRMLPPLHAPDESPAAGTPPPHEALKPPGRT